MHNQKPILLNCFSRGGSTLLVSMLLSHPYVCNTAGETKKVFKAKTNWEPRHRKIKKRYLYDIPIRLLAGQDIFHTGWMAPRKPVSPYLQKYIDKILYKGRFHAMIPKHNLWQYENLQYTREELAKCRMLTKALDGLIFTVDMFREMYPDATFIALIRNGLAIAEGRHRRGHSIEKVAKEYNIIINRMLAYAEEMPNYNILRYEEMVNDPPVFLEKLYRICDLDLADVPKIRVESRPVMNKDGTHQRIAGEYDTQLFWYDSKELSQLVKPDINENQIKNLSLADREKFLAIAGESMEKLGYSVKAHL